MPRFLVFLCSLALLAVTVPTASAQDSLEDARRRRDEVRQEAAEQAAAIDLLEADDAEIAEALAQINAWIAVQEAGLASAEQAQQSARDAEAAATEAARALGDRIDRLREQIAVQSVETYIGGFDESAVLSTDDINAVPLLQFLLDETTGRTADTADLLRTAIDAQHDLEDEARAKAADAEELATEIEGRLADLEESRSEQERLRTEIAARIADLEAVAATLAAEDRQITDLIRREEARIAEERAQAEREAAEQAAREAAAEAERQAAEEAARQAEEAEAEPTGDGSDAAESTPTPTPVPTPPPTTGAPSFGWPASGPVGSGYGNRVHPVYGTVRFHAGVDIDAPSGAPIVAAASGTVIHVGWFGGYGNTVIVDHGNGFTSLYAHMSATAASYGMPVASGEVIGSIGSTGLSTGPHLHFEIRVNGSTVDPMAYL